MKHQLHKIGHKNFFKGKYFFTFAANIIRYCNYKCSYCWEGYNSKDKKDYIPWEVLNKIQTQIVNHCNKHKFKMLDLNYSGGEPLWHPEIFDILRGIASYNINTQVSITTNLSRNMDFLKQFVDIVKKYELDISVSATLHKEFINTDRRFKNFIEKLDFITSNNIDVSVNLVMVPSTFWEQVNQARAITVVLQKDIQIILKHLRGSEGEVSDVYDDEMKEFMKKGLTDQKKSSIIWTDDKGNNHHMDTQLRTVVYNMRNYHMFYCNSGYTSLSMDFDGSMFRGYACQDIHKFGNAYTDDVKLLNNCKPCGFNGDCVATDIVSIKSKKHFNNKELIK